MTSRRYNTRDRLVQPIRQLTIDYKVPIHRTSTCPPPPVTLHPRGRSRAGDQLVTEPPGRHEQLRGSRIDLDMRAQTADEVLDLIIEDPAGFIFRPDGPADLVLGTNLAVALEEVSKQQELLGRKGDRPAVEAYHPGGQVDLQAGKGRLPGSDVGVVKGEGDSAERKGVTVAQFDRGEDAFVVEERPVGGAQVLQEPTAALPGKPGMLTRDARAGNDDIGLDRPADQEASTPRRCSFPLRSVK